MAMLCCIVVCLRSCNLTGEIAGMVSLVIEAYLGGPFTGMFIPANPFVFRVFVPVPSIVEGAAFRTTAFFRQIFDISNNSSQGIDESHWA